MLVDALDERRVVALVVGGDEAGRGGIGAIIETELGPRVDRPIALRLGRPSRDS